MTEHPVRSAIFGIIFGIEVSQRQNDRAKSRLIRRSIYVALAIANIQIAASQVVCIDPGHPSETSAGTRGRHRNEIQVAWRVSVGLAARLRREGFSVILTKRSENELVSNQRRAEIANRSGAALMVRLHCDAGTGSGFGVYYPAAPGVVRGRRGPSAGVIRASRQAAIAFHAAMRASLAGDLPDEGLRTDAQTAVGHRQGALTGSIFSRVPVVLVEMLVLQNPRDEAWIESPSGEAKMVAALDAGVRQAVRPSR